MKLVGLEITVTEEEAQAIADKLLQGVDLSNARPEDTATAVGLQFQSSAAAPEETAGNSSVQVTSADAQAQLAANLGL
ncbi:hypothetical protein [Sphingomonas sp. GC_Shp_3]|uniref:hypothetical protein n=1 Tax=Sphingomonas sp. GC_Shp_3 TaxID=2937383 RepID=UPI00226A26F3|nr:hypothetical protein [Sphingomonas sp. GC_Shp_3]